MKSNTISDKFFANTWSTTLLALKNKILKLYRKTKNIALLSLKVASICIISSVLISLNAHESSLIKKKLSCLIWKILN